MTLRVPAELQPIRVSGIASAEPALSPTAGAVPSRVDRRAAVLVLVVAAVWAFALAWARDRIFHPEMYEHEIIAEHLARGHGFASPLDRSSNAPPTSYCGPAWPWLASIVYRMTGINSDLSRVILVGTNSVFFGALCASIYLIGSLVFFRLAGLMAVGLIFVHKPLVDLVPGMWSRMLGLSIFVAVVLAAILIRRFGGGVVPLIGLGAAMGVLSLTEPSFALAYPVLVLYAAGPRRWIQRLQLSAVALLGFILVLTPWTVRNYLVFGKLLYVRDSANLELWHGNLPESPGIQDHLTFARHPFNDRHERRLMLKLGEPQYFDLCGERFRQMYRQDPAAFWRRTLNRGIYLLYGDTTTRAGGGILERFRWKHHYLDHVAFNSFFAIIGLAGAWMMWRLRFGAGWLLAVGILAVVPYLPTHAANRYALPLRLMLILYGGFFLAALVVRWRSGAFPFVPDKDQNSSRFPARASAKSWSMSFPPPA